MEAKPQDLQNYLTEDGRSPFLEWLDGLDAKTRGIVTVRLSRVAQGNFGNSHSVGDGVSELVIDVGPGYRVYFARDGDTVVVLLTGGAKKSQSKDIKNAKAYWKDYCA